MSILHEQEFPRQLRVNPEVAKALKANGGKWMPEMEELTRRTVLVKSDPLLHPEHFDIQ